MKAAYVMPKVEVEFFAPGSAFASSACGIDTDFDFNCIQGNDVDTKNVFSSAFSIWANDYDTSDKVYDTTACKNDAGWLYGGTTAVNESAGNNSGTSIDSTSVWSWNRREHTATLKDSAKSGFLGMLYISIKEGVTGALKGWTTSGTTATYSGKTEGTTHVMIGAVYGLTPEGSL